MLYTIIGCILGGITGFIISRTLKLDNKRRYYSLSEEEKVIILSMFMGTGAGFGIGFYKLIEGTYMNPLRHTYNYLVYLFEKEQS